MSQVTQAPPTRKTAECEMDLFPDLYSPAPPDAEIEALGGTMHEIAPGIWASSLPEFEVPSHVLCRLVPGWHPPRPNVRPVPSHVLCRLVPGEQPGTYVLEPETHPGYIRMTGDIGTRLGILGLTETTLRRLLYGGFVDCVRPAPGTIMISIESLLEHWQRTRNDLANEKSYWNLQRRKLWKTAIEAPCNLEDGY